MISHTQDQDSDRKEPLAGNSLEGMTWIPGGTFRMGSNDFYPEERPVHRVTMDGFWVDKYAVTNAEFRRLSKRQATSRLQNGRRIQKSIRASTRPS
jgi:formylglycine-generating enzyme required for sulfatase activity